MHSKINGFSSLLFVFLLYPFLVAIVFRLKSRWLWPSFAALNVGSTFALCIKLVASTADQVEFGRVSSIVFGGFALELIVMVIGYTILTKISDRSRWILIAAHFFPALLLLLGRLSPSIPVHSSQGTMVDLALAGTSYTAFRLTLLINEVANGSVKLPTLSEYIAFCYYLPILFVGPITPYGRFFESIEAGSGKTVDKGLAVLRILVGSVKYIFLSNIIASVGYGISFLANGHMHSKTDLAVAVLGYPLFLYCNFSGLCDMAIGASALLGIDICENFNRPFSSRNLQEFWTRWHISLYSWMRQIVFTPLVKILSRQVTGIKMRHLVAMVSMFVFVLIGLWHGFSSHLH